MKISYKKADSSNSTPYAVMKKAVYKFKIESSILKTHYKELARMAFLFNSNREERNSGYILPQDVDKFLALVEKAEKVSSEVASKSHAKTAEKAKARDSKVSCDHGDLGSLGYKHGSTVRCPNCGQMAQVW